MMHTRLIATTLLVAALTGGSPAVVTAAATSGRAIRGCGTTAAGGKTWAVAAAGVRCPGARSLVRKLGAHPPAAVPTAARRRYPSLHLGMVCLWAVKGHRTVIDCIGLGGTKLVQAVAPR